MRRDGVNKFKLPRPKFSWIFGIMYFFVIFGTVFYFFKPKEADAMSEERLFIPSIGMIARVKNIEREGSKLVPPDLEAGAYHPAIHKTVLLGHSTSIFNTLKNVEMDDRITFDNKDYTITRIEIVEKTAVNMEEVVSETEKNTIVLMTCYGEPLGEQDYTHRFIVTAEEDD
jgi:sortase (surface protein transpeptidase)